MAPYRGIGAPKRFHFEGAAEPGIRAEYRRKKADDNERVSANRLILYSYRNEADDSPLLDNIVFVCFQDSKQSPYSIPRERNSGLWHS